jgi:DNA-binding Xre family transcriptional regulator
VYSLVVIEIKLADFVQPQTDVSLYAVAESAGLSYTMLHNLKSGKRTSVSSDSLDRIIFALRELTGRDITPNDLLKYTPDKPAKSKK